MKIALLGYGRMGKLIAAIAEAAGHEIVLRIDADNSHDIDKIKQADVAIDFSQPQVAVQHLKACFAAAVPVVCGTTGWLADWPIIAEEAQKTNAQFFYASNFSLGVNLFFQLNSYLAKLMQPYAHLYQPTVTEIHHTHKLDSPSGTGKTLADDLLKAWPQLQNWQLANSESAATENANTENNFLPIIAKREGEVVGTHEITYTSVIDTLRIEHVAHDRNGFAQGAVAAAEWLFRQNKTGIYGMPDLLNTNTSK
jgi:4-hydroxy-tetrahydrodipicolinate reductase